MVNNCPTVLKQAYILLVQFFFPWVQSEWVENKVITCLNQAELGRKTLFKNVR